MLHLVIYGNYNILQVNQHFRLNSSHFLLAATLNHLFQRIGESFKKLPDKLKTFFYVDNWFSSVGSEAELEEFIRHVKTDFIIINI